MTVVYAIWIIGLILALILGPLATYHLSRLLEAARYTERYTAETLQAGVGIAGNTQAIAALDTTIQVAQGMLDSAGKIDRHTADIEQLLADRARRQGHAQL